MGLITAGLRQFLQIQPTAGNLMGDLNERGLQSIVDLNVEVDDAAFEGRDSGSRTDEHPIPLVVITGMAIVEIGEIEGFMF